MSPQLVGAQLARVSQLTASPALLETAQLVQLPTFTTWLQTTATTTQTCPVGATFATDPFRGRFTITANGQQTILAGLADLGSFAHSASQFRELTSLGDVPTLFPSLRALYLGQISGLVVMVPQRYAIVRGSSGLQARCDAVLDPGSGPYSGCQFTFAFTLAPDVSPVDLAQLSVALDNCPEGQAMNLTLALPNALDARFPQSVPGQDPVISVTDAGTAGLLSATITVRDQPDLPAVTAANILLSQLAADGPSPLTVPVAVHIEDTYPTPVTTTAVLNIRQSAGSDDLGLAPSTDDPPQLQVTNRTTQTLTLLRVATEEAAGLTTSTLTGVSVDPGEQVLIAATPTSSATTPAVDRTLAVPSPLPPSQIDTFVTLNVASVQDVQHALVVNAAAVSFSGAGVTSLAVAFTLDDYPTLTASGLTLRAGLLADTSHVMIPILAVVSGLSVTVTLTPSTANGPGTAVTLVHDFVQEPILDVTNAMLVPAAT